MTLGSSSQLEVFLVGRPIGLCAGDPRRLLFGDQGNKHWVKDEQVLGTQHYHPSIGLYVVKDTSNNKQLGIGK